MNNKFLGMLGLAKRAGKVQTGEDICSKAVKSGVSKLIIVASKCRLKPAVKLSLFAQTRTEKN